MFWLNLNDLVLVPSLVILFWILPFSCGNGILWKMHFFNAVHLEIIICRGRDAINVTQVAKW